MGTSNHIIIVRDWLEFSIAIPSLICSLLTLLLIKRLNTWNGNLLLITTLTFFQICYDVNFMFGISPGFATCVLWHFLDVFGGLGVAFTTNVISYTVCYVVSEIASVNVIENYKFFSIYMIFLPFAIAMASIFCLTDANIDDDKPYTECVYTGSLTALFVENFYYWGRLMSIVLNIGAFIYINYRIRHLGFVVKVANDMNPTFDEGMTVYQKKAQAVKALASRMKYYPVAQVIVRAGSAWNEFNNYEYSNNASALMAAVCSSSSGIVYFIVFLIMQPKAWEQFLALFPDCLWTCFPKARISSAASSNFTVSSSGNRNNSNSMFPRRFDAFEDSALEEIINSDFISSTGPSLSSPSTGGGSDSLSTTVNPVLSDRTSNTYHDIMKETT